MVENPKCVVHEGEINALKSEVNTLKVSVASINAKLPENLIETLTKLDGTFENLNDTLQEIKTNLIPKGEYTLVKNFVIGLVGLITVTVGIVLIQHVLTK